MVYIFGEEVLAKDLIPEEEYILARFDTTGIRHPAVRNITNNLIARPHKFIRSSAQRWPGDSITLIFESVPGDNHQLPTIALGSAYWPNNADQVFREVSTQKSLTNVMNTKAREHTIRKLYENRTGTSGQPGHGPVNTILKMAGIGRKYGGRRRKSTTRKSKNYRKRKQTRKA